MRSFTTIAVSVILAAIASPSAAGKKEVSGLALQQIQARDFEADKAITFPAVMTVLQDAGYRISAADKDTGLITGAASTKSNTTWLPFVGFGKSKKTPVVSAFIEERGSGSRIRLNFVLTKSKNMAYGISSSDEEPITDPVIYRDAFEKIEKEIFVRQSLTVTKPQPPVIVAPSPAAVAPSPTPTSSN